MAEEDDVRSALELITGSPHTLLASRAGGKLRRGPAPKMLAASAPPVVKPPTWLWSEGVTGIGVAEKEVCGKLLSKVVLKVYVEKKLPAGKAARLVPKVVKVGNLPPIETDIVEVGKLVLQSNTSKIRPAIPGYSIGLGTQLKEAGTFGMVVRKTGTTSPWYLLSNAHAIAASGCAAKGAPIIQPGGADGGKVPANTIGTLTDWVPLVFGSGFTNLVDAAIAELQPDIASAAIAQLGVPAGVNTTLTRGQYVQKMGRTTTLSVAQVIDVDLTTPSTYPTCSGGIGTVGFSDQVLVTFYSAGGDSGSPVLNMNNEVVGLHVAGSAVIGTFCKIANIMKLLDIEVVTQQNIGAGPGATS
jgi:hypothetical protein